MNKRKVLVLLGFITILALILSHPAMSKNAAGTERPNVIFIMTDDAGYGDFSTNGSKDVKTPSLDRLATEGIRLTDFYSNGPVCSPTRAGFISGRYQQRVGIETPLGPQSAGLPNTGNSLPQLLQKNGYTTALMGKWHLGQAEEVSPNAQGFDYFFGFKGGFIDHYQHNRGEKTPDLWENGQPIVEEGYMTDLITDHSIEFIKEHKAEPFFLSVQYNAPHWPYQRPNDPSVARNNASHLMPYDENTSSRDDYEAMLEYVDTSVGRILQTLEETGLADNTLVVFTNDNGGEWLADSGPLFNRKWSVWEGGIRAATFARWPAVIPAGQVSDQVGITMDITSTILAITGTDVPDELQLDGMNLMPIWSAREPEQDRELFWRTGNNKSMRSGCWKLVVESHHVFLYDLTNDPGERSDLANRHQDIVARMYKTGCLGSGSDCRS